MNNNAKNRLFFFVVTIFLCIVFLCPALSGNSKKVYADVNASVGNTWPEGANVNLSTSGHVDSDQVTVTIVFDRPVDSVSSSWGCDVVSVSGNTVVVKLEEWGITGNPGFNISGSNMDGISVSSCSANVVHADTTPTTTEPTNTPKATVTPVPTNTPKATVTPEPTNTPKATATPEPTNTPKATATPEPTTTTAPKTNVVPTSTPKATVTPVPTNTPKATATPVPTEVPQTEAPETTSTPVTESPDNEQTTNIEETKATETSSIPTESDAPQNDASSAENTPTVSVAPTETTSETTASETNDDENDATLIAAATGDSGDGSGNPGDGIGTPTPTLFEGDRAGGEIQVLKAKKSNRWLWPILIVLLFLLLGRIYRLRNDGYTGPELIANIIPIPALTNKILDLLAPTRQADLALQETVAESTSKSEPKVVNGYLQKERDPYAYRPIKVEDEPVKKQVTEEVKTVSNCVEPAAVLSSVDSGEVSPFKPLNFAATVAATSTSAVTTEQKKVVEQPKENKPAPKPVQKTAANMQFKPINSAIETVLAKEAKGNVSSAPNTVKPRRTETKNTNKVKSTERKVTSPSPSVSPPPAPWATATDQIVSPFKPIGEATQNVSSDSMSETPEKKGKTSGQNTTANQTQAFNQAAAMKEIRDMKNGDDDDSSFGGFLDRIHKM